MKYKAFTLVELLVVITILGILSTVAFVSYMGYSENSRDSARISNLTKLEKSLEARKAKAGEYPTPDESSDVTYLGKTIFTQGILGTRTKKHLKFQAEGMDPKYEADYTYSVTADGDRFEIGTIMEDGTNNTLGLFSSTYANEDDVALNHGNFNGKFYSIKVNGETHVFTMPSLILKNKSGFEVITNNPTNNFAITGAGGLPETYTGKSKANENINFTPRLLYKGPNCGVETDQEIVNFVATLRDSFNTEPFISDSTYNSVFEDFEYLRNNIDDFETLEEIGIKINEALGCHIKNFKTTDIFPTQCGYEQLNFEGVEEGFDIETQSCLFEYTGNGSAVVRDNIGVGNTKGLNVNPSGGSGKLSYRVFTYKPTKFKFDITSTELKGTSYIEFYINGNRFIRKESGDDYNLGYETYTTSLLPPGLYDFEWKIYKNSSHNTQLWLDNLDFSCVGGGAGCGWTLGFESGDHDPNEMFTFDGEVNIPWQIVEDATEGSFAIVNPLIDRSAKTNITYTKLLENGGKLSFDYKIKDHHDGVVKLFIDGIQYKQWGRHTIGENMPDTYGTYITPLLEPGEHSIRLEVYRNWNWGHKTFLYLDNFQTYCEIGDTGCGMDLSFEHSDTPYLGYFSFDGETTTPWGLEQASENVSHGINSMRTPITGTNKKTYMHYHKDFEEPAKISFDYKLGAYAGSWVKVYIDDKLYKHIGYQGENPGSEFQTFTTPLLHGQHKITLEVFRNWSGGHSFFGVWGHFIYFYIDNFRVSCFGGVSVPGNESCGWDLSFEDGGLDPNETFEFTGGITEPWTRVTGSGKVNHGTYALLNPRSAPSTHSYMTYTRTINQGGTFNFDFKVKYSCGGNVRFLIDNIEQEKWGYQGITPPTDFTTYSTDPLDAGTYKFTFDVYRNWNSGCSYGDLYLDNMRIE